MTNAEFETTLYNTFFKNEDCTTSKFRYTNGKYPGIPYSKVATQTRREMLKEGEVSLAIVTPYAKLNVRFGVNVEKRPYMLFDASTVYCSVTKLTHNDTVLPLMNHLSQIQDILAMLDDFKCLFGEAVIES
jgi:hypothetical protein